MRNGLNPGRRSAVITGLLLIAGLVTGIFSVVPVVDGADYLVTAFTNENQVLIGAFFQLLMVVAYVGIPIMMYPILSKHNKGLALGSVAFGIIAGVFFGSYWVYLVHIGKLIIYESLHRSGCNLHDHEHSNSLSTIGFGFMANY